MSGQGGERDRPIEYVEARRRMARKFLAAQGRALNAAARTGPLARVGSAIPPASTDTTGGAE